MDETPPNSSDSTAMRLMSYRGFVAEVERDPELGVFVGTLRDAPDLVRFQAPSVAELPAAMAGAVDDYIAMRQEWGLPCVHPFLADRRVRFGPIPETA